LQPLSASGQLNLAVGREVVPQGTGNGFVVDGHKRFSLFWLRRKMGSFGIFRFGGSLGRRPRLSLLNPWWHGG
jgi:hypothetical protein